MGPPGHFATALAAKPAATRVPLWILLVATEILDLLCFGFMAAGLEYAVPEPSFPWSHGLFMSVVWSALAGVIAFLFYRDHQTSVVVGLLVFSHWVLDFIAHDSDLPLLFSASTLVGLGIEDSLAVGLVMEFGLLTGGIAIYRIARQRKTKAHASM